MVVCNRCRSIFFDIWKIHYRSFCPAAVKTTLCFNDVLSHCLFFAGSDDHGAVIMIHKSHSWSQATKLCSVSSSLKFLVLLCTKLTIIWHPDWVKSAVSCLTFAAVSRFAQMVTSMTAVSFLTLPWQLFLALPGWWLQWQLFLSWPYLGSCFLHCPDGDFNDSCFFLDLTLAAVSCFVQMVTSMIAVFFLTYLELYLQFLHLLDLMSAVSCLELNVTCLFIYLKLANSLNDMHWTLFSDLMTTVSCLDTLDFPSHLFLSHVSWCLTWLPVIPQAATAVSWLKQLGVQIH